MLSIKEIKEKYKITPDKSRGQNFLIDGNVLAKIIEAGEVDSLDTVVEIGAGLGVLTSELVKKAGRVLAFEIDKKLAGILRQEIGGARNLEIFNEDGLEFIPEEFLDNSDGESKAEGACAREAGARVVSTAREAGACASAARGDKVSKRGYKVMANIPYNITSKILEKFLSLRPGPELIVLLVQKEVAERICATAGKISLLSVVAQYYGEPRIVKIVSSAAFWPRPKVDSAILAIKLKPKATIKEEQNFLRLVKAGFKSRRKMLFKNLKSAFVEKELEIAFKAACVDKKARAEELNLAQWLVLQKNLSIP